MQNATWLFRKPTSEMKNSESRWTAVAQMSLIYMSSIDSGIRLPVYQSDKDGYLTQYPGSQELLVSGFTCLNTVCECGLSSKIFPNIQNFDKLNENKFLGIKPDILHINETNKKVILIEVKTVGESVARNINLYRELEGHLKGECKCDLYYLLSHGHEKPNDWLLLSGNQLEDPPKEPSKIILWEDLFGKMAMSPLANLIGDRLGEYCEPPAQK